MSKDKETSPNEYEKRVHNLEVALTLLVSILQDPQLHVEHSIDTLMSEFGCASESLGAFDVQGFLYSEEDTTVVKR